MSAFEWLYFGCVGNVGHYLHDVNLIIQRSPDQFARIDGALCPANRTPYRAVFSRLYGLNASIISFWDYTVDTRSGSNSNFILVGNLAISPVHMMAQSVEKFPQIHKRLPTPLQWHLSMKEHLQ